uniref:Adenylate kinase isoenzyme 5 n=1 Tax=Heterorhabditis bacteriophora TaxID=37862 RepID=A0A1I7WSP3_HETBA
MKEVIGKRAIRCHPLHYIVTNTRLLCMHMQQIKFIQAGARTSPSSHHSEDSTSNVVDISSVGSSAPVSRTTSRPPSGAELPPTAASSRRPPTVKESRSQSRGRSSSASSVARSASIKSKRSSISSIKENPQKPSSSSSQQPATVIIVNEENSENVDPSSSNPTVVLAPPTAPPTASTAASDEIQTIAALDDKVPQGLPNNAPVVLVIGAPGAQKSDIAKRVAQKYDGFVLLSMGDLLRAKAESEKEDELWQRIKKKIDQGETVPMKLCRELLYNELHNVGKTSWGYVIEGYPRTQAQLEDMENVLGKIDMAILIDCTEQFCMNNIEKRYQEFKNERPGL